MYMDLLALLYRLMAKSRQQGMFSLERDIENPKEVKFSPAIRAFLLMP